MTQSKKKRPNVLFILTDDQRYDTIHALGNDEIITPNLDKLVHGGTSFVSAHIPGGTASAVCMPSRAMINSGKNPFRFADNGKDLPSDCATMGEAFKNSSYRCCGIGKWHNGTDSYARSFTEGDDIFFGGMWDHWNVPVCNYREDGNYDHEISFVPNFSANMTPVSVLADRINAGVHSTELFAADAIRFIEEYDSDEPFFLYLSFLAPHDPRTMPEKYRNMPPILYYGASIDQGGCASRPDCSYTAMLSKWNDIDFINLGFSGNCKGEPLMAEYLSKIDCSLFFMAYDGNAPSVEYLAQTHYPFYQAYRQVKKDIPIVFMSVPCFDNYPDTDKRREVLRNSFIKARESGDNHVYFIDGETLFGTKDREICTVEGIHPNDLGFYRIAEKIYELYQEIGF